MQFPESLYQLRSGLDLSDPAAQFRMDEGISASAGVTQLGLNLIGETTAGKYTIFHPASVRAVPGSGQRVVEVRLLIRDLSGGETAQVGYVGSDRIVDGRVGLNVPDFWVPAGFQVRGEAVFDSLTNANTITVGFVAFEIPAGTVRR